MPSRHDIVGLVLLLLSVLFSRKKFRNAFEVQERIITFLMHIYINYTKIH